MARRPGKIYSDPKGYRASLTGSDEDDRRRRSRTNAWGASRVPSGYKPGVGAPRAPIVEATETKEDMDARRDAISKASESLVGNLDHISEVLAAVASHGTVEASQRGMYSGRTVQAPSSSGEIAKGFEHLYGKEGGEGLTDRQKEGIERSVNAEIESRMQAKQTGAAYTGAHSAEEQQQKNLDYQNALVKQFGEAGAKERLGDRWTETSGGPEEQKVESGPVTREFAPGIAGYTAQPPAPGRNGNGSDPDSDEREIAAAGSKRPDADILADKSSSDSDFIAAAERQANAIFDKPGTGPSDNDEDEPTRADDKGGQSGPVGSEPSATETEPEPEPEPEPDFVPPSEFSPLFRSSAFDDPAEAARAIAANPDMDYPDLVDAAAAVAAPNGTEPEGYDPDVVFRGVLERRIVSDLFSSLAAARNAEQASADYYHGTNARSVANACGASPDEYALALELSGQGDPSALLRMQMKFMDSF